jgi:uncharacterized protein (TIGR02145 family)
MSINVKETPLKASNTALYKSVDGVTYFKLKSEFSGDYTKNCGLLGEEIDENFYFLRGYDIESVDVDENRNLIINRVDKDYKPIVVKIGEELGQPKFEFKKEDGTIVITFPDGSISTMDGFLVEGKDIRIATDSTLSGDGTIFNPMRIADVETTGTFAPVNEYFDLTDGSSMPDGIGKGYRIITKEKIDNFGRLYPFKDVLTIQKKLKEVNSPWRIPSKQDWDELLNAFECAEHRNHSANTCTWLGEKAGAALKSTNMWMEYPELPNEILTDGQDIVAMSIYPLGLTPDRNEILNDKDSDAEGFSQIAGMWTSSVNNEGNAYVKLFGYNSAKVDQDTYGEGARMSIRLCKDYSYSNYNKIETILGLPYPTELVYGNNEDYPYVKIWTKINAYFDGDLLNGIVSDQWSEVTDSDKGVKIVYFINEWDGFEWHKKPMTEGDSVVILDYIDAPYHEWRLVDGILIDTIQGIKAEFASELERIDGRIDDEITARKEEDIKLAKEIFDVDQRVKEEAKVREQTDIDLKNDIRNEVKWREKEDKKLSEEIDSVRKELRQEVTNRIEDDSKLAQSIAEEVSNRIEADKKLQANIDEEIKNREESDNKILENLQNEINRVESLIADEEKARIEGDEILARKLENEVKDREAAIENEKKERIEQDNKLQANINDEINARELGDKNLQANIDAESKSRQDNDITPDTYTLKSNETMILPTNGEDIDDVKINISDDFFNFGTF